MPTKKTMSNQYKQLKSYQNEDFSSTTSNEESKQWVPGNHGDTELSYRSENSVLNNQREKGTGELPDGARKFYKGEYTRMASWLMILVGLWLITRVTCTFGYPDDCVTESDGATTMNDIQILLLYGFVQAWFIEILYQPRFWYLFSLKRWYFWMVLFGTPPVFSWISSQPIMEFSISSSFDLSTPMKMILILCAVGFGGWLLFHIGFAFHIYNWDNFLVYLFGRVGVLTFFIFYMIIAYKEYDEYHFHHYWLAWAVSLFASFNHPASLLLLAVSTGIMAQGLGAYHTDFEFYADD